MSTPEGKVKALVKRRLLAEFPDVYQFWPVQTGRGKRTLDCLFCVHGFFFAVETKRPGKDLTEIQKDTRDEIVAAGGAVYKVDNAVSCELMIGHIKFKVAASARHS